MTIQALAPYYKSNTEVKTAVDRALDVMSGLQKADGGFASWGTVNSESCAQVICGLLDIGRDAGTFCAGCFDGILCCECRRVCPLCKTEW